MDKKDRAAELIKIEGL